MIWAKNANRVAYSPKLVYKVLFDDGNKDQEPTWWSWNLWKFKCLLKNRIFMWLVLNNKALTWDNIQKKEQIQTWAMLAMQTK